MPLACAVNNIVTMSSLLLKYDDIAFLELVNPGGATLGCLNLTKASSILDSKLSNASKWAITASFFVSGVPPKNTGSPSYFNARTAAKSKLFSIASFTLGSSSASCSNAFNVSVETKLANKSLANSLTISRGVTIVNLPVSLLNIMKSSIDEETMFLAWSTESSLLNLSLKTFNTSDNPLLISSVAVAAISCAVSFPTP